jgi:hypothetical protein
MMFPEACVVDALWLPGRKTLGTGSVLATVGMVELRSNDVADVM